MCDVAMDKREEYNPEHDARDIARAEEIRNHSGRMRAVVKHVNRLHAALHMADEGGRGRMKKRGRRRGGR